MRSWIVALVLAIVAIAPIAYVIYTNVSVVEQQQYRPTGIATVEFQRPQSLKLEQGVTMNVLSCKVIDGYKFELYLEGNKVIVAHLPVATKEEAIPLVIEWLNTSTPPPPTVTLLRQIEDYWIVDFHLTHKSERIRIVDLLRSKNFLLE